MKLLYNMPLNSLTQPPNGFDSEHQQEGTVNQHSLCFWDIQPLHNGSGPIEMVKDFTHLGSKFSADCEIRDEVRYLFGKPAKACGCLHKEAGTYTHTHTLLYTLSSWTLDRVNLLQIRIGLTWAGG